MCGLSAILILSLDAQAGAQQELSIHTPQDTYYYGDRLILTILVSEVTGESATLYIMDEFGTSSSPILLPVDQSNVTLTSPYPFDPLVYPTGEYTVQVLYDDSKANTTFILLDSGRVIVPEWIKDVGRGWAGGALHDQHFASAIRYMIQTDILVNLEKGDSVPEGTVEIPAWLKISADWWTRELISDDEFINSVQFLIHAGVIVV